ncbi:hypothetical protein KALB_7683 [Kutzneria albida DSM 43870]|uniref:HTH gntR-type domain-containing protein n=1 Tax=Kutzneria albida DSM 43870 TaxID=1449976 RepID=W5WJX0_9PSEU|nr:hypothetical protein KALB_7683 [Kutzneria albida DSM 43870]
MHSVQFFAGESVVQDYRVIADRVAADIAAGRMVAGERLPPQRRFARVHGIASSTAARVYGELVRRGLAVGEVGRGTFVRAAEPPPPTALAEPASGLIDLTLNFPLLPEQPALLAASTAGLSYAESMTPVPVTGTPAARAATSRLLARAGWSPDRSAILFAGNGRQAIAGAVSTLVPVGERLGVEAHTYPLVKTIAARLGVRLVPLAMDEHGLVPEAVRDAPPLRAIYLQPALHNPLGVTMPEWRRAELAVVLRELGLYAIEDGINSFLCPDLPPLAANAPDRVLLLDSMSKRIGPGLTLGFCVVPPDLAEPVATTLRAGGWAASRFPIEAVTRWIDDGTAETIARAKRLDALARQEIVAQRLTVRADPRAYHCWWELPDQWRAETFVAAAARRGIAVTPAAAFTVGSGHAPNAVRLAISGPGKEVLARAMDVLAALAAGAPEDAGFE